MAFAARWISAFCVALAACGGDKPRTDAPSSNLVVPPAPADAGAPSKPAPVAFDSGLPKGAVWVASLDAGAFADLLKNNDATGLVAITTGMFLSNLADLDVDRSGSVQIAQVGINDIQRAILTGPPPADAETFSGPSRCIRSEARSASSCR